jgi:4-hydroxy-2-oxoheptanedioate aldolase
VKLFNPVKQVLRSGKSVHGLFLKSPDPVMAEIIAASGVDFVACDAEHGAASPRDIEGFCRAMEARGGTPFARVASGDRATLLRTFDAGCLGVHVPWVEDAAQAQAAVANIKYEPQGKRGIAGTRVSRYGQGVDLAEYMAQANEQTLVCLQVESAAGVAQAEAIAAVPGVDVVFVGPTDLSNAIGHPLQFDHPMLVEMIEHVLAATLRQGRTFGIFVRDAAEAAHWHAKGARYFISNFEGLVFRALKDFRQHQVA